MFHTNLIHRGSDSKEKYLLARFKDFENNNSVITKSE
jgi:hypothetical protein